MNIFEEIERRNAGNLTKQALVMRLEDGTERSYSYGQMFETASLFCEVLEKAGIRVGDRIAIVAESCPEWTIAYLAIMKCRATALLLDASLERRELSELLVKADVRCLFASPKVVEKLGGEPTAPVLDLLKAPADYLQGTPPELCAMQTAGDALAASVIFSSGTTKKASGILHSHDSLILSTQMCIDSNRLVGSDRFLAILPNSHIYGLVCQLLGPLLLGSPVCFLEGLNSAALVGAFLQFHPSILPAVPKIYDLLKTQILQKINGDAKTKKVFALAFPVCLKLRQTLKLNLGKKLFKAVHDNFGGQLRVLCSAGAPLSSETAAFFYGLGFDMLITYGATETCIPTIGNLAQSITTDTCGRPYPAVKVKISGSGEILVQTPYRMLGYFHDEQATREAFDEDGWFRSGDLGSIDEMGNVRVLGRCKENIVLATGKKVTPDDVESAYADIGGVKELVVCGVPVADGSHDEVHAFVTAQANCAEAVLAALRERSAGLSQSQKLTGIHFVEQIPKTSLQKPKRFLLKQMLLQERMAEAPTAANAPAKEIAAIVRDAIARVAGVKASEFTGETKLFEELPIDSLGVLDLACEIEEQSGVRVEHMLHRGMSVAEVIACALSPDTTPAASAGQYPQMKRKLEYNVFCLFRGLLRGIYRVKVENDAALPETGGYIICANHVSNFDFLYLTLNFGKERFAKFCCMAKKELFQNNFLSRELAKICGMIPVDRSDLVAGAMSAVHEKLTEQWGVLIHPEGTRSENGQLGAFKNGAAVLAIEADVPIVPAYIKGGYEVYPCWRKLPQLFDWKKMRKYQVEVIYGDPILPGGLSPEELMKTIEAAVAGLSKTKALVTMS